MDEAVMGVECRDTVEFQGGLSAESQPTTKDDHLPAQLPVGTALSKSLSAMYLKSHGPLVCVYIYSTFYSLFGKTCSRRLAGRERKTNNNKNLPASQVP